MFFNVYHISNIVFYCLFGLCFLLLLFKIVLHITAALPSKKFPKAKEEHKFAILIPARNESKVIRGILASIQNQTYNQEKIDTYVIVESKDDPTCQIASDYPRTHVVVRKNLDLKGKGYALDECMQEILSKPHDYEAYFIFDADNILDSHYLEEMNKVYDQGYKMGLGYRNSKNWNDNWISACSGLTFSIFNLFNNKPRSHYGLGMQISGTGFYVSADILEELGGWKFFTMTEDYELTMYSTLHNIKSTYNEQARFYDEQPTSIKQSWLQRVRWCKGYNQAYKKYSGKLIRSGLKDKGQTKLDKLMAAFGVVPLATTIATIICYQVFNIAMMIAGLILGSAIWYMPLIGACASGLALYLFLALYTMCVIIMERKNINLRPWRAFVCIVMNPFYMLMFLPIYIHAACKKDVEWVAIEHNKSLEA